VSRGLPGELRNGSILQGSGVDGNIGRDGLIA
jgi:hypothetical protein